METGRTDDQRCSSPVKFINEIVEKRCLEQICDEVSEKSISRKQSFQLKNISGSVKSSKTGSGGTIVV